VRHFKRKRKLESMRDSLAALELQANAPPPPSLASLAASLATSLSSSASAAFSRVLSCLPPSLAARFPSFSPSSQCDEGPLGVKKKKKKKKKIDKPTLADHEAIGDHDNYGDLFDFSEFPSWLRSLPPRVSEKWSSLRRKKTGDTGECGDEDSRITPPSAKEEEPPPFGDDDDFMNELRSVVELGTKTRAGRAVVQREVPTEDKEDSSESERGGRQGSGGWGARRPAGMSLAGGPTTTSRARGEIAEGVEDERDFGFV